MPLVKYTQILVTLQARIDDGRYGPGTLLPSEAALAREFAASRNTVVRALRHLDRHGWVDPVRGRGRVVLGRPAPRLGSLPRRLQLVLQPDRHGHLLGGGAMAAPPILAAALACVPGAPLATRRYLLAGRAARPFALATMVTPAPPLPVVPGLPLLAQLETTHGLRAGRVLEHLGARLPTDTERRLLSVPRARPVVVSLVTVLSDRDHPFLVVEAVLTRDIPALTSSFDLT